MLSLQALESAMALTERFDQRGLVIVPRPDTPLQMLVTHTRSAEEVVSSHDGVTVKVDVQQMALSAAAQDPVFGDVPHDKVLDDIAAVCIPAVQGHIKFAKEVVAPAVNDLVTRVVETMSSLTPSKILGMEVTIEEVPAPLSNSSFDSMVRKFEETPFDNPQMVFDLPEQSPAELLELMKTGSGSLDGDIEQFVLTYGSSCLINLWRDVFQKQDADINAMRPKRFVDFLQDPEYGLDNAMVIFLLARKLVDNPLDGLEMSLQTYETLMADYRDQAAAHLCREIDAIDQAERNGAMVVKTTANNTVVNANLYRKWIEDGGDNDVLFGNLLQSNPYVMVEDLEANALQLKRAWANHSALVATVESNRKFARTKEAFAAAFRAQLAEMDDEERANVDTGKACAVFEQLLDDVCEGDLDCLFTLGLKLICRSRFARTEAERILSGIDRVKKKNPNLDIREAAGISMIEYVAWWVSTQMQVIDAKTLQKQEAAAMPVVTI